MRLFGNGPAVPTRHPTIPMDQLVRLAGEVENIAQSGQVEAEALDDLSADLGVPREKLYVGLGASPHLQLVTEHPVQFLVCSGGCQERGALVALRTLLDAREERIEDEKIAFDVIPRQCLSRCQVGAVAEVRTPDGTALLTAITPESLISAIAEILD
ncbi:MAG: hypothetical protein GY811_05500 [Myxococcales bacterium]|nr:hypothetical protein [Myxococcales bacterium]